MRRLLIVCLLLSNSLHAQPDAAPAPESPATSALVRMLGVDASDGMVAARRRAIEIAGAFSNGGFKLRDGALLGELQPDKAVLVQVNVFKGNEYWFTAATQGTGSRPALTLYDQSGTPLTIERFEDENAAALGIVAPFTGPVFVRISLAAGPPSPFALIYSYR